MVTAFAAAPPAHAASGATISWRVENPFRFFTDPRDTEVHRATYLALGDKARHNPVLLSEQALQERHNEGWAATMFQKTCWNEKRYRFQCDSYEDYINPKSHRVIAQVAGIEDASALTCRWFTAPKGGKRLRGDAVTQPCDEPVAFEIDYPHGADLSVEVGGVEVARTEAKVIDLLIVGMGDSFASGEGNPDIPVRFSPERSADYGKGDVAALAGYPARAGPWRTIGDKTFIAGNARWLDQACHRSLYSHQLRAALQIAIEDPHRSVAFVGLACSGAEVTDGLFLRYKGHEWVPNPPQYSQISAAAQAQCGLKRAEPHDLPEAYHINGLIPELKGGLVLNKCPTESSRKIDLVFLSIGGNDVGFSRLVANAVLSEESTLRQIGGWFGQVHGQALASQQVENLKARYKSLNRAMHYLLHIPWKESDRVILTGYPGLALAGDGSETCKDGRLGMEIVPDFALNEQKLRIGTWIADKLHRTMRDIAYSQGWSFAENHRRDFIGRGLCSGIASSKRNANDELRLPRFIDGQWSPYNPSRFKAYASRQRWFRTPNDAFMTAHFHVASSLLSKVLKLNSLASFQLILASTYSGSFHPTAEGQAAIADAVVQKARVVLGKYGQATPREQTVYQTAAPAVDEPDVEVPDINAVLGGGNGVPGAVGPDGEPIPPPANGAAGVSPDGAPTATAPPAPLAAPAPSPSAQADEAAKASSWAVETEPATPATGAVPPTAPLAPLPPAAPPPVSSATSPQAGTSSPYVRQPFAPAPATP